MRLTAEGHLHRLQGILAARALDATIRTGSERGRAAQVHRRQVEVYTRQAVVRATRQLAGRNWGQTDTATALGLSPRTLAAWMRRPAGALPIRGRPARHADPETSHEVFALLQASGPGTGLSFLEAQFPELARNELRDLRRIYQEQIFSRRQVLVQALHWQRPGTVWAMDFAHAPSLAEGGYQNLLVVRDLASGKQLLVLPAVSQDTGPVLDALQALFLRHGPPLVMKTDNGAAFVSQETKAFLETWKVEQLLSPPGLPSYNGSVEAGIGSLRIQAHYESARHGRSGEWTCDDVEAARQRCNLYGRPRGRRGPNPHQLWQARRVVRPEERERFRLACALARWRAAANRGACRGVALRSNQRAAIEREAITESLIGHEHLVVRKGWISQPVTRQRARKIS